MVRTLHVHCKGCGFHPWSENLRSHMLDGAAKRGKKRNTVLPSFSFSSFSMQVLVQPQIIKTDSLVLTTLKTDGSPVMAAVQNPALTALTTPIQTAALQVPVRAVPPLSWGY